MKQYEITEHNNWEAETFGYLLNLTEEQAELLKIRFYRESQFESCIIKESSYTADEVEEINKKSRNRYMKRLDFYELYEDTDLNNCGYGDFPYKGNGMFKAKKQLKI